MIQMLTMLEVKVHLKVIFEINVDSFDLDWATVLHAKTQITQAQCEKSQAKFEQNYGEDSNQLYTPVESEDEQEYEIFPSYKVVGLSNSSWVWFLTLKVC